MPPSDAPCHPQELDTVNGDTMNVMPQQASGLMVVTDVSSANTTVVDLDACASVVHAINRVLMA